MSNTQEEFDKIMDEISQLRAAKNKDYGDSFIETYNEFGLLAVCMDLGRKMQRLNNITKNGHYHVKGETLEDLFKDMAAMSVNAIIWLRVTDDNPI
jgi:lipid II:glycine glycyltransferase (peptidoglycan interpeptide bridge formation enzyme)